MEPESSTDNYDPRVAADPDIALPSGWRETTPTACYQPSFSRTPAPRSCLAAKSAPCCIPVASARAARIHCVLVPYARHFGAGMFS